MNSGNMTPKHLEWVAEELDEWCGTLRFSLEPSTVTSFYVDLAARDGLRRRAPVPLEGRVLFLDTRSLHAVLMQSVVMLEQKIRHQPLSERTPKRAEQLALVTRLASQVDPEFKPFARRGERTAAAGVVDAIVGFTRISGYLKEEEHSPLVSVESGKSFGGTMELAVFGRVAQRERPPPGHRSTSARVLHVPGRTMGSQGCEPDRLPRAGADERRHRGDARDAGGDSPARRESMDAGYCAANPPDDQ